MTSSVHPTNQTIQSQTATKTPGKILDHIDHDRLWVGRVDVVYKVSQRNYFSHGVLALCGEVARDGGQNSEVRTQTQ